MTSGHTQRRAAIGLLTAVVALLPPAAWAHTTTDRVARWDVYEVTLRGPAAGNPFLDVNLSAEFTHGERTVQVSGFYDGEGIYKIRFMPCAEGEWTYVTESNHGELDGKKGEFTCVEAGPGNHGPVRVHNQFQLVYADGTPHFSVGTTCYAWTHQGDAIEEQTLATLKNAPFNKMRMCVFPDPYQKLRSIHNAGRWYDHSKPWVTHLSIQTTDFGRAKDFRDTYGKPVIYDECRYEGDVPQGWGNISPQQMTRFFWLGSLAGCYVSHGETYQHPEDLLWWTKGGVLRGQSPVRIQFMKDIIEALPFQEMVPDFGHHPSVYILAKPGDCYLMYFAEHKPVDLELPGDRPYKLDAIDPWEMKTRPMGSADPGPFRFTPSSQDYVIRLIRY